MNSCSRQATRQLTTANGIFNGGGPAAHGYDEGDGEIGNEYAHQYGDPNPADIFGMAKRAVAFMEKNKRANKPFFIQMSWHALHAPQNALKTTLTKYAQKMGRSVDEKRVGSAAIAENLDTGVGMVVDAIDRLGLADNTFVIYMSDNGSGGGGKVGKRGSRDGLAGGKGGVWEGGIRSPMIIRGPGIPAASWCHERVVGYDFYPTYCEWAGIPVSKLPPRIEGGSIAGLLGDGRGSVKRPREEMVFHFPHYQGGDGPHSALFLGNHKLMKFYEDGRLALFDIKADVSEQNDLSQRMPQRVKELDSLLVKYLRDIDAQMATPNTNYDPSKAPIARKGGGGRNKTQKSGRQKETGRNPVIRCFFMIASLLLVSMTYAQDDAGAGQRKHCKQRETRYGQCNRRKCRGERLRICRWSLPPSPLSISNR